MESPVQMDLRDTHFSNLPGATKNFNDAKQSVDSSPVDPSDEKTGLIDGTEDHQLYGIPNGHSTSSAFFHSKSFFAQSQLAHAHAQAQAAQVQAAAIAAHLNQQASIGYGLTHHHAAAAAAVAQQLPAPMQHLIRKPILPKAFDRLSPSQPGRPSAVSTCPDNNVCSVIKFRSQDVAAFRVDGRELICLPQAFDLFLKDLVGGLHTVYTKLKRLEITPVVCNVEQVRILRGLGAIQPGVNRCKLISCLEFDVLYDDCTNAKVGAVRRTYMYVAKWMTFLVSDDVICHSARPGRPPKRAPSIQSSPDPFGKLKMPRLDGPEYNYNHRYSFSGETNGLSNGFVPTPFFPQFMSMNSFMPQSLSPNTMALASQIALRQTNVMDPRDKRMKSYLGIPQDLIGRFNQDNIARQMSAIGSGVETNVDPLRRPFRSTDFNMGWHSGGLCSEPINLSNGHERTPCHPSPHDRIPSSEEDNVAMNDDDKLSVNDQHTAGLEELSDESEKNCITYDRSDFDSNAAINQTLSIAKKNVYEIGQPQQQQYHTVNCTERNDANADEKIFPLSVFPKYLETYNLVSHDEGGRDEMMGILHNILKQLQKAIEIYSGSQRREKCDTDDIEEKVFILTEERSRLQMELEDARNEKFKAVRRLRQEKRFNQQLLEERNRDMAKMLSATAAHNHLLKSHDLPKPEVTAFTGNNTAVTQDRGLDMANMSVDSIVDLKRTTSNGETEEKTDKIVAIQDDRQSQISDSNQCGVYLQNASYSLFK